MSKIRVFSKYAKSRICSGLLRRILVVAIGVSALGVTQISWAEVYRLSGGVGKITEAGVDYKQASASFGISKDHPDYAYWGQIRSAGVRAPGYQETKQSSGFGYAGWMPASAWWMGGGAFSAGDPVGQEQIEWLQASYAFSRAHWLNSSISGGVITQNRSFLQGELSDTRFFSTGKLQAGVVVSGGKQDRPGAAMQLSYTRYFGYSSLKGVVLAGDLPGWFERETLLHYRNAGRLQGVGRLFGSVHIAGASYWEITVEYNRVNQEEQWYGSTGVGFYAR